MFGGTKCRTIDKVDIFGDSSGVSLYQLDGNANDTGGNYHGTETAITYGGGVYERGAVFNGSSSVVTASNLKLPIGAKSISFWVKSTVNSNYNQIINDSNTGISGFLGVTGTAIAFELNTGKIYFKVKETPLNSNIFTLISATSVTDGNWHHIVCLWDGTTTANSAKIYIDGVLSISGTASGLQTSTPEGYFTVGRAYGTADYFFNGLMDQIRIFNRAITATEVATLYAECAPTSTVDSINPFMDGSLKALYKLDGDATDATGVYNGTATNVTYATGKFGQCAVFNGSAYIYNASILTTTNFTHSFWYKSTVTTANIPLSIGSGGYVDFIYIYTSTNIQIQFASGTKYRQFTTPNLNDGKWHHICSTSDGVTCSLYINGVSITGGSVATLNSITGTGLYIGRYFGATPNATTGSIDQVRIFNKAITPMEVASLYNETTPLEEPMYKLVDPFKDGSGKVLYRLEGNALDESGKYNGTATGVTYGTTTVGREAIFNGSASISVALALSANTFSYSVWATVTTVSSTIQSLVDFSTGRAMLSSGNGTNTYLSYYDGTAYRVFGTYALTSATKTHIGIAVNGTSVELFINGVSQGTSACSAVTPSGNLYLGRYAGSAAGYLTGREDQPRIFTRVLTASEFQQLYTQGA